MSKNVKSSVEKDILVKVMLETRILNTLQCTVCNAFSLKPELAALLSTLIFTLTLKVSDFTR